MPDNADEFRAALRRAMPITRMLDYGMSYHDATTIHHDTEQGGSRDAAAVRRWSL